MSAAEPTGSHDGGEGVAPGCDDDADAAIAALAAALVDAAVEARQRVLEVRGQTGWNGRHSDGERKTA